MTEQFYKRLDSLKKSDSIRYEASGSSPDPFSCLPNRPLCPVDWRWHRARFLANGRLKRKGINGDAWIKKALKLIQRLERIHATNRPSRIKVDPAVQQAFDIRFKDVPEIRWELETRLLRRQSIEEIAREINKTPEAILAYEALFFAVLDRFEAKSYIAINAAGRPALLNSKTVDLASIWRCLGYFGAPFPLEIAFHPERFSAKEVQPYKIFVLSKLIPRSQMHLKREIQLMELRSRPVEELVKPITPFAESTARLVETIDDATISEIFACRSLDVAVPQSCPATVISSLNLLEETAEKKKSQKSGQAAA